MIPSGGGGDHSKKSLIPGRGGHSRKSDLRESDLAIVPVPVFVPIYVFVCVYAISVSLLEPSGFMETKKKFI